MTNYVVVSIKSLRTLENLTATMRLIESKYLKLSELEFVGVATAEQKAQLELIEEIYKTLSEF